MQRTWLGEMIISANRMPNFCQAERTKFDRFVDPNVRGVKLRDYSDLRIYCLGLIAFVEIYPFNWVRDPDMMRN